MNTENDFEVLKKGLEFTISVFVASSPDYGFSFMESWIGKNRINRLNLK